MDERAEKITIVYNQDYEIAIHGGHCTFCGQSSQVSDYKAGGYVVQICDGCGKNPPGVVAEAVEAKIEIKKKKK